LTLHQLGGAAIARVYRAAIALNRRHPRGWGLPRRRRETRERELGEPTTDAAGDASRFADTVALEDESAPDLMRATIAAYLQEQ